MGREEPEGDPALEIPKWIYDGVEGANMDLRNGGVRNIYSVSRWKSNYTDLPVDCIAVRYITWRFIHFLADHRKVRPICALQKKNVNYVCAGFDPST
jgi:hypothetical protein